jgi:hypothetical protein
MNLFDLFESNRKEVDEGHRVVPGINRERYTDLSHEGLEGPFSLRSGKVVYYDPKVGKYYDRDTDMYMSHDDYAAHELDEKSNKLGFKLSPSLVNRRQAHALTTGFKKSKFNFEEYEAESLDDEFSDFKNRQSTAGRARNPFANDEPAPEAPRKPQISPAEIQQRTSQLNRCKQLLDVVNASSNPDPTLLRIGNFIDKIDVNHFNPGELDKIEKYLSNYVAGAVAKKSRKASKSGKVSRIDPADVMAENQPRKRLGPDMDDPYEQGWYAHWSDANPYQKGTQDHARWAAGQTEREAQPNHYDESIEEGKTGPGLWANIHKKQERIKHGSKEHMRKPGSKGAPTNANFKAAAKTEDVAEGSEKKTMSRAAKGNEKYGKAGMQALAKAGREGKDLDKVRDKYNKYDESVAEGAKVDRMVKHIASSEKKSGKSAKDAESIAWATANKRGMLDNKNKKKQVEEGDMASAAHHPYGAKFGGYYKGTQKGAPRAGQGFGSMEEGIAGNMKVRSDPLTNLKHHKDIKMKQPDPFKGMANHNNLASAKARNLVAKGAQTAGPGTGSHKNKALDVKKGLTRNLKHKDKFDFSESVNFLTWAVSSGYNVITNPAVYENAKRMYNTLLTEGKNDLKPDQYYIWTVHFDDGDTSRIKIKDEKFDVKAYYKQKNKSVVSVDYNWEPHSG